MSDDDLPDGNSSAPKRRGLESAGPARGIAPGDVPEDVFEHADVVADAEEVALGDAWVLGIAIAQV